MPPALSLVFYGAAATFLCGTAWRVWVWAATPEPFCIPTTSGQQRSLRGITPGRIESPSTGFGVAGRLILETLLFRSLFRNTAPGPTAAAADICPSPVFLERKALWLAAMALHWSLLIIVVRHLRLFVDPVPGFVAALAAIDGFFELGTPRWYASNVAVVAALGYLGARRLRDPLLRYLTLPADFLALAALAAAAGTGIVLRYVAPADLVAVRGYTLSLVALAPGPLPEPAVWLAAHLVAVSFLLAILPFTKMMHAAGIWLVPTRNQPTDSRRRRHVNPWNAPVNVHTYEAWRDEFRDKLERAGQPADEVRPGGPHEG